MASDDDDSNSEFRKSITFSLPKIDIVESPPLSETVDLQELVRDKPNLQNFKEYLRQNNALTDLLFWLDVESYL